jgi:hypothetical protein
MPKSRQTKASFFQIALAAVQKIHNQLFLFGIAIVAMLIALLVWGPSIPDSLKPVVYTVAALPVFVIIVFFLLNRINQDTELHTGANGPESMQGPRFFVHSDSADFAGHVERLFMRAKRIVLIGTGLNILHRDPIRRSLMQRAADGKCHVEIYLANPFSPAVENRLVEEQIGSTAPPVGKPGLIQRLRALLEEYRHLGSPPSIEIRLFGHYPTFALLIADMDYFLYPYGYATLGNFSPVICVSGNDAAAKSVTAFMEGQYERIKSSSIDAETAFPSAPGKALKNKLHAFAVYFIPSESLDLYKFGSEVLGYDVRARRVIKSRWNGKVGSAAEYGFHLTCCDALYFLNAEDLALAIEQTAFLAREFSPFELEGLQLQSGFPDDSSISLVAHDRSGTLEAFHCELVALVYRRAIASNYTLGKATIVRDKEFRRAELMTSRFKCPYILKNFQPHFTLLSNVKAEEQEQTARELRIEFKNTIADSRVRVAKLAIMGKTESDSHWHIAREISLG